MNCISFQKPLPSYDVYLIIVSDMVIGSIHFENDIITNIDINGDFFHIIKDKLIPALAFELGTNRLDLICKQIFFDFYNELGFKKQYNTDTNRIVLRYDVRCTCRGGEKME